MRETSSLCGAIWKKEEILMALLLTSSVADYMMTGAIGALIGAGIAVVILIIKGISKKK